VFGFVGFIDHADDPRLSVVQLGERLQDAYASGVYVQVFENRQGKVARKTIWELLDVNHDGLLSLAEKKAARIILYGHSWGGSTVASLARELNRDQIPVLLTVQVDSIHKLGANDAEIPANVLEAANFYQSRGFFHGRTRIYAADPASTSVLGNYRFEYQKDTVRCPSFSGLEMYFARSHIQMHCDPKVWKEVEELIRDRLPKSG
jgi:pimeloyl-ACP methyl ester carboxylesterase